MRKELKDFDWHTYGLSIGDFDYTLQLVKKLVDCKNDQFEQRKKSLSIEYASEPDIYDEIVSDLAHYNYIENQFLYHFALTRSQGIFEGVLKQEFFHDKNLIGLKTKLKFVRDLKYNIDAVDYDAILEWGSLRNALSHFPPEQYRPGLLNEDDVKEYISLAKKVITNLTEQKKNK